MGCCHGNVNVKCVQLALYISAGKQQDMEMRGLADIIFSHVLTGNI